MKWFPRIFVAGRSPVRATMPGMGMRFNRCSEESRSLVPRPQSPAARLMRGSGQVLQLGEHGARRFLHLRPHFRKLAASRRGQHPADICTEEFGVSIGRTRAACTPTRLSVAVTLSARLASVAGSIGTMIAEASPI